MNNNNNDEAIKLLESMGFNLDEINYALQKCDNNAQIAAQLLLTVKDKMVDNKTQIVKLLFI